MREDVIRQAVDNNLSGLYVTQRDEQAIMNHIWEGKQVKRKFSAALVLALALLLAAAGAVAAVFLGGKDFTSQVVAPIATQSESETFTQAEVGRILELARENGIEVPENLTTHWETWGSEYKEELMRALVKTELGFYPGSWSLADQHWYNKLLVECGLSDGISCLLPGAGDFTQEEVLAKAVALITAHFHPAGDLTDAAQYRRSLTFGRETDSAYRTLKEWAVSFESLNGEQQYIFNMLENGVITDLHAYGVNSQSYESPLTHQGLKESFCQAFGESPLDWPLEVLEQFYHAQAMARGEAIADPGWQAVSQQRYLLPGKIYTYMAEKTAVAQARAASGAEGSLTPYVIYFGDDPNNVHWKISFRDASGNFVSYAQIDGSLKAVENGQGRVTYTGTYADKPWYAPLVREEDQAEAQVQAAPLALTQPDHWRSPLLSDSYWEALEALGYNAETAEALKAQWRAEYGDDVISWPAECEAVVWWWEWNPDIAHNQYELPGLLDEGDMPCDQALAIAWEAFQAGAKGSFTQGQIKNTRPLEDMDMVYCGGDYSQHLWRFDFQTDLGAGNYSDSVIKVDAKTGEVVDSEITNKAGNG